MSRKTIASHLEELGVDLNLLDVSSSLEDEFKQIKKSYFKAILTHHPDKGGDATSDRS